MSKQTNKNHLHIFTRFIGCVLMLFLSYQTANATPLFKKAEGISAIFSLLIDDFTHPTIFGISLDKADTLPACSQKVREDITRWKDSAAPWPKLQTDCLFSFKKASSNHAQESVIALKERTNTPFPTAPRTLVYLEDPKENSPVGLTFDPSDSSRLINYLENRLGSPEVYTGGVIPDKKVFLGTTYVWRSTFGSIAITPDENMITLTLPTQSSKNRSPVIYSFLIEDLLHPSVFGIPVDRAPTQPYCSVETSEKIKAWLSNAASWPQIKEDCIFIFNQDDPIYIYETTIALKERTDTDLPTPPRLLTYLEVKNNQGTVLSIHFDPMPTEKLINYIENHLGKYTSKAEDVYYEGEYFEGPYIWDSGRGAKVMITPNSNRIAFFF